MRLGESIGLREGEGGRTGRLFAFVFLLTCAIVLGKSGQREIFLAAFPRSSIPDAFLLSAVVLALASLAVSALAARLGPVRLLAALLLASAGALVLARFGLESSPRAGPMGVYVLVEVLTSLLLAQGWAVVAEGVDVRSAKRLMPLIGLGAGAAWTAGGFVVGGLARLTGAADLLIAAAGMLVATFGLLRLVARRDLSSRAERAEKQREGLFAGLADGLRYIGVEPLMRILAVIITVELVVEKVTDLQLLSAAQEHYANQPGGIASFMGLFYGVTGAVTLIAPLAVSGRVLSRFGSTRALIVAQVWVLVASVVVLVHPSFLVIVALAGGDRILKQALTAPARSQIFGAVPAVRRAQAAALLRGVLAAVFSALAAAALKTLPEDVPIRWLSVAPIALGAVLVFVTWRDLRSSYLVSLRRTVDKRRLDFDGGADGLRGVDQEQLAALAEELHSADPGRATLALTIIGTAGSDVARQLLRSALVHPSAEVRALAVTTLAKVGGRAEAQAIARALADAPDDAVRVACLKALSDLSAADAAEEVRRWREAPAPKVRALARACLLRFEELRGGSTGEALGSLEAMLRSSVTAERAAAAWAIGQVPLSAPGLREVFAPLLRDPKLDVRRAAVGSAGRFSEPSIVRALVLALEELPLAPEAFEAFARLGDASVACVEEVLETAPTAVVARAASALARVPGARASALLNRLLEHSESQVRYRAARALAVRRRADDWRPPEADLLLRAVRQELEQGYRYYATLIGVAGYLARDCRPMDGERKFLTGEIDSRIQMTERRLLALIALVADPRVARLSHHLREASPQVVGRVLELLESSLDAPTAELVVPFLEPQSPEARARTAEQTFHIPAKYLQSPLEGLLDLDDDHLRRCAVLVYRDKIAERYPDLLNREESLLPLVERIRFLRSVPLFKDLSAEDLMKLAEIAEPVSYRAGEIIFRKGDPGDVMCVIVRGSVEIRDSGQVIASQGANEFFGELAIFDNEPRSADAVATSDTELLEIGEADLGALMERRPEIAREVIRVLARRLRKTTQAMVRTRSDPQIPVARSG